MAAGKEGFDITVGNNTDLKGAVIASEAEKEKNRLTTGTLSFSDLSNKAEYESKGIGLTLNANKTSGDQPATEGEKGLIPNIPAKVSDDAESTTKSAVSEGTITVTKPEKQKQDVSTLNRDTKETLNQLDPIFDIEKIRENQETAALFGELAANGIHVVAEKNHWKDGSPEKIALHAAVGAVLADLTNGNAAAGAIAGGSTEYLTKAILKASKGDKAQAQWIAMIVGAAMSKATGGNPQLGAMVAINAIQNNLFWEHIAEFRKSLKEQDLSNLEPWECRILGFNFGDVVTYNEMAIIFNSQDKDVFSSWSIGVGLGFFPLDGVVGRGHLEDINGNIVTNMETIREKMPGASISMGGAVLGGYSEARSDNGYKFIIDIVQSNISFTWGVGDTTYLGGVENVSIDH